ncbi:unnamed protein product, partial [Gulo gulo]
LRRKGLCPTIQQVGSLFGRHDIFFQIILWFYVFDLTEFYVFGCLKNC